MWRESDALFTESREVPKKASVGVAVLTRADKCFLAALALFTVTIIAHFISRDVHRQWDECQTTIPLAKHQYCVNITNVLQQRRRDANHPSR